jgi:serine/threonine protein kinase
MSLLPFPVVTSLGSLYEVDEIYDFIGSGTFSSVYKGKRREDGHGLAAGEEAAIKVIPKSQISSEKAVRDIINEVAILKRIDHPNCVKLYEAFQTAFDVCLVLQLVPGEELFQAISKARKVISEETAKQILVQILTALAYLHDTRYIVHRDLKPENILIAESDESCEDRSLKVTLVDFGLAKFFGHPRAVQGRLPPAFPSRQQRQGSDSMMRSVDSFDSISSHFDSPIIATPCGTLKYASPETVRSLASRSGQWETTRGTMPKADIYSVGIIAYVLLCGELPFDTKNKAALASAQERGPVFEGPRWQNVSPQAISLVCRMLSHDPSKRPSASEALKDPWLQMGSMPLRSIPRSESYYDDIVEQRDVIRSAFEAMVAEPDESERRPSNLASLPTKNGYFSF